MKRKTKEKKKRILNLKRNKGDREKELLTQNNKRELNKEEE